MAHVSPEVAIAINRQKARYCRYADTKQWDKLASDVTLPDARLAYCDSAGAPLRVSGRALVFDSAASFAAFYTKFFAPVDSMHNLCPADLEQVAPDEVKAVFGFEDQVVFRGLGSWGTIRGGGYYHNTWKHVDGEWYISELKMIRTYQTMTLLVWIAVTLSNLFGISL